VGTRGVGVDGSYDAAATRRQLGRSSVNLIAYSLPVVGNN